MLQIRVICISAIVQAAFSCIIMRTGVEGCRLIAMSKGCKLRIPKRVPYLTIL